MRRIYREEWTVSSDWVDRDQRLRISTLFRLLQEVSLCHATELGLGKERTLDRGLLWVVTRQHVELERLPHYGERIVLETWPGATKRMLFPRYYRMLDERGNCLLKASALWVIIDAKTRRMVIPEQHQIAVPAVETGDEIAFHVPQPVMELSNTAEFVVPYSYIDLNGHMNNTRYFDVCEDVAYPKNTVGKLKEIRTEYNTEAKLGQTLRIDWGEQDGMLAFIGTAEQPCFRVAFYYETE